MAVDIDLLNSNSLANITTNFERVEAALQNTVGRSGTTPNEMNADLDMDDNDILNVRSIQAETLTVGSEVVQVNIDTFTPADNSVSTVKVQDKAITLDKISTGVLAAINGGLVVKDTQALLDATTPNSEDDGGWVLNDPDATNNGYYSRIAEAWVKGRDFPDTFAKLTTTGTGTAQTASVAVGVDPASIQVYFANVVTENTGAMTLSISGETPRDVVNAAGNPLAAGEWTGVVLFFLNDDGDYQLINDAGAAASAAASASLAQYWAEQADETVIPDGSVTEAKLSDSVISKLGPYVNVMDVAYGVTGDGVTDDWAALNAARDAAVASGKLLYFPKRTYAISDRWYFADGGDAWFEPGATLKLTANTVSGGAVSGPYPTQTLPIEVHNLTIDCNNLIGENGIGFGHTVGASFTNLTIRNCLHNPTPSLYGGKALQFEGTTATNCQVRGLNIENCSFGIDIGAHAASQSVHIGIFDVTMRDVDIPIHVNDTNLTTPVNSYDSIEVLIDGIQGRNCGRVTWAGGDATGGGIIVSDRGYKLTVRNFQFVNDKGGFGSTSYGNIGALVRGTCEGLVIENGLLVADAVALVDFNYANVQSTSVVEYPNGVLADNIRHYGNLDYVMKAPSENSVGTCLMRKIEIGSTLATIAGLIDPLMEAATTSQLEVIDRDANFLSTGLRSSRELYIAGNSLATTIGTDIVERYDAWTPVDASGAGLTFTVASGKYVQTGSLVQIWGYIEYPVTADTNGAVIGAIPAVIPNNLAARSGGSITISTGDAKRIFPTTATQTAVLLNDASSPVTNADMSGKLVGFKIDVPLR